MDEAKQPTSSSKCQMNTQNKESTSQLDELADQEWLDSVMANPEQLRELLRECLNEEDPSVSHEERIERIVAYIHSNPGYSVQMGNLLIKPPENKADMENKRKNTTVEDREAKIEVAGSSESLLEAVTGVLRREPTVTEVPANSKSMRIARGSANQGALEEEVAGRVLRNVPTVADVPVKSKSAKKREQKKRSEARKRNETILELGTDNNRDEKEVKEHTTNPKSEKSHGKTVNSLEIESEASTLSERRKDGEELDYGLVMKVLMTGNHLQKFDAVKVLMINNPCLLFDQIRDWITEGIMDTSCEVTSAFWKMSAHYFKAYAGSERGMVCGTADITLCAQVYRLFSIVFHMRSKRQDITEEDLGEEFKHDQFFTLPHFPVSNIMRDVTAAVPLKVFKHMMTLLESHPDIGYMEPRQLVEFQIRKQNILKEGKELGSGISSDWFQIEQPLKNKVLQMIARMYHFLAISVEIAKRNFYESDELLVSFGKDKLPSPLELMWIQMKDGKKVIEFFYAFEEWLKPRMHEFESREDMDSITFEKIKTFREKFLKFLETTPCDEVTKFQRYEILCYNDLVCCLYERERAKLLNSNKDKEQDSESRSGAVADAVARFKYYFEKGMKEIEETEQHSEISKRVVKSNRKPPPEVLEALKMNVADSLRKIKTKEEEPRSTGNSKNSTSSEPKNPKSVGCENEECVNLKKLYLQERNNRTLAEGELKQSKPKLDEWKKLKKDEEKWKTERKELEKKNRNLEKEMMRLSSQAEENKKLRKKVEELEMENRRLISSKEKVETGHGALEREYNFLLEKKREQDQDLQDAEKAMLELRKEKQALLEENQHLNGPISRKTDSVEDKQRWHEKLREDFKPEKVVNGIRNMTDVLKQMTPEFQALMETEQKRLLKAADMYSRILDYNLQLLKETNSNVGLLPVPMAPTVSPTFVTKFNDEMKKQFPEPDDEVGFSTEKTCYTCFEPFRDEQRIYECERFYKHIVCFKCGDKIIQEGKGVCGHCEGALKFSTYEIARFQ